MDITITIIITTTTVDTTIEKGTIPMTEDLRTIVVEEANPISTGTALSNQQSTPRR